MVAPIPLHPRKTCQTGDPTGSTTPVALEGSEPGRAPEARSADGDVMASRLGPLALRQRIAAAFPRRAASGGGARPATLRLNAAERAFLPAVLEIVETPASPTLRWTGLALCALVVAALTWASLARVDMVAVAPGKVVPLGQVKVVQPLETAMVRAIHVDEGDHVVAGQALVDLDPTEARADLGALTYDRAQAALDAEVARVLATRKADELFQAPSGADPTLVAQNRLQASREIDRHLATIAGIEADVAEKQAGLESNAAQIERLTQTIPLLDERLATASGLYDKRYGARQPVLDAEQHLVEKRGDLKAAQSAAHEIEAAIRSLRAKADETRAGFLADATDRRTKALQKVAGLDQQITKARQKERYRSLTAAVDGTVQGVKIHTPGAVVTTADVLMTIVPDGAGIEVEAQVQNGDIGFVAEGQSVEVKLEAFPFTRYGLLKGIVRKLGRDAVSSGPGATTARDTPSAAGVSPPGGAPDLAYPAKVQLLQDWILVDGRREKVQPGMRLSAEIRTGDRRVIDYLLSPVRQAIGEAGRER